MYYLGTVRIYHSHRRESSRRKRCAYCCPKNWLCCACESLVQKQITTFRNIQTASLHIVACRCLEANRLELGLHAPDNDKGQTYTHRNRNRDPNQSKRQRPLMCFLSPQSHHTTVRERLNSPCVLIQLKSPVTRPYPTLGGRTFSKILFRKTVEKVGHFRSDAHLGIVLRPVCKTDQAGIHRLVANEEMSGQSRFSISPYTRNQLLLVNDTQKFQGFLLGDRTIFNFSHKLLVINKAICGKQPCSIVFYQRKGIRIISAHMSAYSREHRQIRRRIARLF